MRKSSGLPRLLASLGLKQVNQRWSWGAVDHDRRLLVLLVWVDDLLIRDGQRYVVIRRSPSKQVEADDRLGRSERERHIELIRDGYTVYLIMQKCIDVKASPRQREWFSDRLSTAGEIVELEDGRLLIEITGKVEAVELRPTKLG